MAEAHNAVLVRRVVEEIWNRGKLDVADVLFASDYINHAGLIPDFVRGPEAIKKRRVLPHHISHLAYHHQRADGEPRCRPPALDSAQRSIGWQCRQRNVGHAGGDAR